MAVGADQSDEVQEKADRRNISAVGADPREIKESSEEKARKARIITFLKLSSFLSICQHAIMVQTEPMLLKELYNGDVARSTKLLANTQGIVGLAGLFLNQAGGKLSDALGRKPFLLLGPLGNIILGATVFNNIKNRTVVTICRILRLMITTFSSTVMIQASLADTIAGKDLAVVGSEIGAIIGAGMIVSPILESYLLRKTGSKRSVYAALAGFASIQAISNATLLPETLPSGKTTLKDVLVAQTFNPFGFVEIYRRGSVALKKLVSIASVQMFLEGKNVSDIAMTFMREDLGWSVEQMRNYIVSYGMLCIATGVTVTPYILRNTSVRVFTSLLDVGQLLAYSLRAKLQNSFAWWASLPFMLPGVNGNTAQALKALAMDRATAEGFGKGEFSAYFNNLRGLAGSVAPVIYGNAYSWAASKGIGGGSAYWVVALIGGLLPEVMLWNTKDEDLEPVQKKALAGGPSTKKEEQQSAS
mmetsp:Transcript_27023/g.62429  ORF Transcript_27023/g.62429 Transcript_27023/m.62429 type:complete len:474 (+) Transcript_27023:77-1498(+)